MLGQSNLLEVAFCEANHPMHQTRRTLERIQPEPTRHRRSDAFGIDRDHLEIGARIQAQEFVVRAHAFVTSAGLHFKSQPLTNKSTSRLERGGGDDQVIQFEFRHAPILTYNPV